MKPCRRQVLKLVFTVHVTVVSKASWVVRHTMNNHTYNAMKSDNQSCLGAKDTFCRRWLVF